MSKLVEIALRPEDAVLNEQIKRAIKAQTSYQSFDFQYRIKRRSIDARGRQVLVRMGVEVFDKGELLPPLLALHKEIYKSANHSKHQVVIIGAGPAGLFAALRLLEYGIKPIVIERGKDVRSRRRDLAAINKDHIVNPESNYCFGEGGAGTYSDGKLYTRSKKRGDIRKVLEVLVAHGATEDILVDAHPHIGTNKLPVLVTDLRETVKAYGGEVLFDTRVEKLIIKDGVCAGVLTNNNEKIEGIATILCTGHSARDIFYMLNEQGIHIEAKPFALGVRIEHPQTLIDSVQYHCAGNRGDYLPAAAYSLVTQTQYQKVERGVYSFCMCPGGFIVPAATAPGELVVNGMSPSKRDSKFANSGIVVAVELDDIKEFSKHGAFAALEFQKSVEQNAWAVGGKTQTAPAQRVGDFIQNRYSSTLPDCSYQPGLKSAKMDDVLPTMIAQRLRQGLNAFENKIKGYTSNEGLLIGVESRTSSPVFVPRDKETLQHVTLKGLYPCGEGAGYAGGIMSAAMDGESCALRIAQGLGLAEVESNVK
ncbi:MAG TPA: FAD-binding protein [Cytophaga sp.]|nr:FAD-binding protein [Cytophaga sp.]